MAGLSNIPVVTGVGVLAANGIGKDRFWRSLLEGESGIGPITLFDAEGLACQIAGEVRGFDPSDYIDGRLKPKRMGRFAQLGIAATRLAVEDAGLDAAALGRVRDLHVVLGVSTSAMDLIAKRPTASTAVAAVPHAATSAIGYLYHARPVLKTVSDGCASSLDAVAEAARLIRRGKVDLVLAGGAEGAVERYVIECMLKCRRCSTRNAAPRRASRPFDADRDYGVMAEAAGMVVVENLDHARARGVAPYGEIAGYGTCADPSAGEEGSGIGEAMRLALANAGSRPAEVDYLCAHGPSDLAMDALETRMIKEVLGEHAYRIPVTSIKGNTGCPMGAGGILQLIACCQMLRERRVPPTANYEKPDPECDLDYVPGRARRARIETALLNTHGFGRGNGAMVLRRLDT